MHPYHRVMSLRLHLSSTENYFIALAIILFSFPVYVKILLDRYCIHGNDLRVDQLLNFTSDCYQLMQCTCHSDLQKINYAILDY